MEGPELTFLSVTEYFTIANEISRIADILLPERIATMLFEQL